MGNVLLSFLLPSHTTFNIINTSLATSNYTHKECALFLLVPHSYIMLMNQCQFNIILYSLDILGKFHFFVTHTWLQYCDHHISYGVA
jgi:hypothetical protein